MQLIDFYSQLNDSVKDLDVLEQVLNELLHSSSQSVTWHR